MPSRATPAERLKRIGEAIPEAAELARAVSLCVRAEPELVRILRQILLPRSGAWIEADLYFSPLVGQRTPDWIVLDGALASELREDLNRRIREDADQRRAIGRLRAAIERAHSRIPFEIRLEEDVISLAVERRGGVRRTQAAIDRKLRSLLGTLLQSTEKSVAVARWFAAAARRMPSIARETEAFALLAFASSSILGGRRIDPGLKGTAETFQELSRYLPASVNRMPLWIGMTSRGLHFAFGPEPEHREIEVPRTDPVLLEIRAGNSAPQLVNLTAGRPFLAALPQGEATIRTLSRDSYRLRPRATGTSAQQAFEDIDQPSFDIDVFISFAFLDVEWVRIFEENLQGRLSQHLGRHVSLFSDSRNVGMRDDRARLPDQIADVLRRSAAFVAVVSPGYLESMFASREREAFEAAARAQTGLLVGSESRIVPVMPMPVDRAELPSVLASLLGYQFFTSQSEMGRFHQFKPGSREYNGRLDDVARDLARMFRVLRASHEPVYIAAGASLAQYRDRLTRELLARGYTTLEEHEDPRRSLVYIVLIDETSSDSAIEALLAELRNRPQARGYFWIPRETPMPDRLRYDQSPENVDLVVGTGFEQFVAVTLDGLTTGPRISRSPAGPSATPTIYLMCADQDQNSLQPLIKYLEARVQVRLDPERARSGSRRRLLAESDGVLVYWGMADQSRIEVMIAEALRSRKPVALYVGPPRTEVKRTISLPGDVLAIHAEEPSESAIEEVVKTFTRGRGGDVAR